MLGTDKFCLRQSRYDSEECADFHIIGGFYNGRTDGKQPLLILALTFEQISIAHFCLLSLVFSSFLVN